ncbi:hypothetical protein [Kordiimonas sp.]|uniref:hypothetical protein n=1 Tax=Kordiimonas sp. TaxID=1970157 RepID=UPI003A8D70CD
MKSPRNIENSIGRLGLTRVAPWLAMLFVAAQLIASAHAAAFADSEHTHDGHPCIIATACKHTPDVDAAKPVAQLAAPDWHIFYVADTASVPCPSFKACASARGPPSL